MKNIENSECLVGFGNFIKAGRERKDMLQREVADLIGISQSYYSYIESGVKERKVDLALAIRICKVLDLDLSEFIKRYI